MERAEIFYTEDAVRLLSQSSQQLPAKLEIINIETIHQSDTATTLFHHYFLLVSRIIMELCRLHSGSLILNLNLSIVTLKLLIKSPHTYLHGT